MSESLKLEGAQTSGIVGTIKNLLDLIAYRNGLEVIDCSRSGNKAVTYFYRYIKCCDGGGMCTV